MEIYKGKECIDKYCKHCNKKTCHDYVMVDVTITKGNPDVVIKCEVCNVEQYITEGDWVINCYFPKE